ncbi:MAG: HTH domain-containing protein [Myxococcaceae bacterium]|nr:HTH domain-containing protein [Myxococcaceae bacterium]
MKRQERLFAIAEFLRGRRTGVTASVLAERFGLTLRTIYRDLDALREAGLPLHGEQGRGGGYALDRHYGLPPINLNAREAALLVALGTQAQRLRTLPFTETLQSALDKVRGALSVSAQRELLEVLGQLDHVGVPAHPVTDEVRRGVEEAWFARRPLRVEYRRREGSLSVRTVRIERVVMERTETRLNVVDVETGERRQYALHHLERAEAVGEAGALSAARGPSRSPPTR